MSRIKCPNCGSSAQLECVYLDTDSYDTEKTDDFVCGCGCVFSVTFKVVSVDIQNQEDL